MSNPADDPTKKPKTKPQPVDGEIKDLNGGPPHSEPGRSAWFKATAPISIHHARPGAFQAGLRASDSDMVAVYEEIRKQIVNSGVLHVFLDGPHGKEPYRIAQEQIVKALQSVPYTHETNIKPVPEKWLRQWARVCVQDAWSKSKHLRQKPEVAKGLPNTLSGTTLHLSVLNPDGAPAIDNIIAEAEIAATRCVPPNTDILATRNYLLALFLKEFEVELNNKDNLSSNLPIFKDKPFNGRHGTLSFKTTYQTVKEITLQRSFEAALTQLFNARKSNTITFYFALETPSQEKARVGRELAAQRSKDALQKREGKKTPLAPLQTARRPVDDGAPQEKKKIRKSLTDPTRVFSPIRSSAAEESRKSMMTSPGEVDPHVDLRHSKWSSSSAKSSNADSGIKARVSKLASRIGGGRWSLEHPLSANPNAKNKVKTKKEREIERFSMGKPTAWQTKEPEETKVERLDALIATKYTVDETKCFVRGVRDEEVTAPEVTQQLELERTLSEMSLAKEEVEIELVDEDSDDMPQEEEFLVAEVRRLQDSDELMQLRDPTVPEGNTLRWNACCEFFQLDQNAIGPNELIPIAGLKNKVYQYQAFGVYWQMIQSREIGGGFVADEMGLGKTLSFLSYIVVERQLAWLWSDIARSRKDVDGRHFSQHLQDDKHKVCPSIRSRRGGWIACPCAASSITANMKPKPGIRLAVVPPGLVLQWREQWNEHVDVAEDKLQMRLAVAHPPAFTQDGRFDIIDARHAKNTAEIKARPKAPWKSTSGPDQAPGPPLSGPDVPNYGSERMLLLTTAHQYKNWVKKAFEYDGVKHRLEKNGSGKVEFYKGKRHGIVVGIAMSDECHEDYLKNKGRSAVLAELEGQDARPFLWGYSGTPLSDTPRGLEGVVWALEHHREYYIPHGHKGLQRVSSWDRHNKYKANPGLRYKDLDVVCHDFERYVKRNVGYKEMLPGFKERLFPFLKTYMLRRTTDSLWFGRPLIKLKPHYHHDIFVKPTKDGYPALQTAIKNYMRVTDREKDALLRDIQAVFDAKDPIAKGFDSRPLQLNFNTACRAEWKHRVFATFPYLVLFFESAVKGLPTETPKIDMSSKECMQWRSAKEERKCPYFQKLNLIVENSPKCCWLYNFIRTQILDRKDTLGRERKLLIITSFNVVGLILKMFIENYFKHTKTRVGLLHTSMPQRQRTSTLDAFTDALIPLTSTRKNAKENLQFLIGPPSLLGKGLQLTRAANIVLMEPDYDFGRETQAYARVNRIGQRNDETKSYRLVDAGSAVERRIVRRQDERHEWPGRAIDEEDVGLAGVTSVDELEVLRSAKGVDIELGGGSGAKGEGKGKGKEVDVEGKVERFGDLGSGVGGINIRKWQREVGGEPPEEQRPEMQPRVSSPGLITGYWDDDTGLER